MIKIQAKQVHRLLQSVIGVAVTGEAEATSVTADLAAAVIGAGWRESDVPNQAYAAPAYPLTSQSDLDEEIPGWRTSDENRVEIWVAGTEEKLVSETGEEVYGRLVDTAGTVELFTLEGSTETAYTLTAEVDLDLALPYVFSFETLPLTALTGVLKISQDPSGSNYVVAQIALDNAPAQSFGALDIRAAGEDMQVNVNGQVHELINGAFTVDAVGTVVTWVPSVAGFAVDIADTVTIRYDV
jgi:hypothetical protein